MVTSVTLTMSIPASNLDGLGMCDVCDVDYVDTSIKSGWPWALGMSYSGGIFNDRSIHPEHLCQMLLAILLACLLLALLLDSYHC